MGDTRFDIDKPEMTVRPSSYVLAQLKDPDGFIDKVNDCMPIRMMKVLTPWNLMTEEFLNVIQNRNGLMEKVSVRVWNFRDVTQRKQRGGNITNLESGG